MNKELTPLQALEEMYNVFRKDTWYEAVYNKQYETIKKSLKVYEQLKTDYDEMDRINTELNLSNHQLRDENVKLKKALKIIKEHKLLNYVIKNQKCAAMYHLSEEEIEHLKGVSK